MLYGSAWHRLAAAPHVNYSAPPLPLQGLALVGAMVTGVLARKRRVEMEHLNAKLRHINAELRRQREEVSDIQSFQSAVDVTLTYASSSMCNFLCTCASTTCQPVA